MNSRRITGFLLLGATIAASAQPFAFEVATVKPAAPPSPLAGGPVPAPPPPPGGAVGDRVTWTNMSLRLLIGAAYRLKDYQVIAPDWMKDARFDISAKMPAGTTSAQALAMLQSLLDERFKLTTHREQRELPMYSLIPAKSGLKLQEASTPSGLRIGGQPGTASLTGEAAMPLVATILSLQLDRPVIDMTGLRGIYEIDVSWTPAENERNYRPGEGSGPSVFTAMEETLGIKLDPRKAPVEVLVIDRAERTPAAN